MKTLKKILAIVLLIIFTFNVIGYYLFFEISAIQVKEEMAATISRSSFSQKTEIIVVPINELTDLANDEIWYNNKLYDIVKKEIKNDSIFLSVLNDQKEEHLITNLGAQLEPNDNKILHAGKPTLPLKGYSKNPAQKYLAFVAYSFQDSMKSSPACCSAQDFNPTYFQLILTPPPKKQIA